MVKLLMSTYLTSDGKDGGSKTFYLSNRSPSRLKGLHPQTWGKQGKHFISKFSILSKKSRLNLTNLIYLTFLRQKNTVFTLTLSLWNI